MGRLKQLATKLQQSEPTQISPVEPTQIKPSPPTQITPSEPTHIQNNGDGDFTLSEDFSGLFDQAFLGGEQVDSPQPEKSSRVFDEIGFSRDLERSGVISNFFKGTMSYLNDVGEGIAGEFSESVSDGFINNFANNIDPQNISGSGIIPGSPKIETIGLAGSVIGDVLQPFIGEIPVVKDLMQKFAETEAGQVTAETMQSIEGMVDRLEEINPDLALKVRSAGEALNIPLAGGVGIGLKAGVTTSTKATGKLAKGVKAPTIQNAKISEGLVNDINKVTPLKAQKFAERNGKNMGEWLVERGIIGTREETMANLLDRFKKSKGEVDGAFAKIPGKFSDRSIDDILGESLKHATKVKDKNGTKLLKNLNKANKSDGLSMSQINTLKRYYEKNFKFGYQKDITKSSEQIQAATNTDKALRDFQFGEASKAGFDDLARLNKETSASKEILDAVGEKYLRQLNNNAISLTDWVMASGVAANPASFGALIGKKIFDTEAVRAGTAKIFAPIKKVDDPVADVTKIERRAKIKSTSETTGK